MTSERDTFKSLNDTLVFNYEYITNQQRMPPVLLVSENACLPTFIIM